MGSGVWDQRRRVHRLHNERVKAQDNWARWIVGSAALDMHENERPPKTQVIYPLCNGLIYVIGRIGVYYDVMVGKKRRTITYKKLMELWEAFYIQFESVAGVNATKQPTPTALAQLPAPKAPYGLLPATV